LINIRPQPLYFREGTPIDWKDGCAPESVLEKIKIYYFAGIFLNS
jgi:hypothetical protein